MPTIEEQKQIIKERNNSFNRNKLQPAILATQEIHRENPLISHNLAIKQLLKDCKVSAPANGIKKTVVTKQVIGSKFIKIVTSKNYSIQVTNLGGHISFVEKLSEELILAKEAGLITTKLIFVEESKEVNIQHYSYTTKIKTNISTLQGVK